MTTEHLRVLFESRRCQGLFFKLAERLARADVPDAIISVVRMGRMTAVRKADGGVRGIVAGPDDLTTVEPDSGSNHSAFSMCPLHSCRL